MINFKMLPIAREARGLTQAELVTEIPKLTQGNYSKMEKGLLSIPNETLNKIAEVLKFPVNFFGYEKPIYNQTEYFYRKRLTMPRKQQIRLEASFDIFRIWIEELLSSVEIPEFLVPPIKVSQNNTPEDIARKVRTFLKVPKGPIDKLVRLLERSGIIVFFMNNVPEKFDGTTVITSSGQYIIVINNSYPNDRKRFTIAHEFFHIISHMPFNDMDDPDRDKESEANRFAAEFLMPEMEIRRDLENFKYSKLGDLKLFWKSSKAAILFRALTLRFIDRSKYTNMMIELSRSGERKVERLTIPMEEPKIIRLIIEKYTNEFGYSIEELCNSIFISEDDLNQILLGKRISNLRIAI